MNHSLWFRRRCRDHDVVAQHPIFGALKIFLRLSTARCLIFFSLFQVFGLPHERYGETVSCWIKLRDPSQPIGEQEIKDFCKDKVSLTLLHRWNWSASNWRLWNVFWRFSWSFWIATDLNLSLSNLHRWLTLRCRTSSCSRNSFRLLRAGKCRNSRSERLAAKSWAFH